MKMNIIAINGSARKGWNTHLLLQKALDGARSAGAETELVNLYDLSFKGCVCCLACKSKDNAKRGQCALRDDLQPVLQRIAACGALIIGSPIYFSEVTGVTRSFLERLLFPNISYDKDRTPITPRKIRSAFVFTMNVGEDRFAQLGYNAIFDRYKLLLGNIIGESESLTVTETWQTEDYDSYHMTMFDGSARKRRREDVFPQDLDKAFQIGFRLGGGGGE
jgi:multimeric flavodoxin WrbA